VRLSWFLFLLCSLFSPGLEFSSGFISTACNFANKEMFSLMQCGLSPAYRSKHLSAVSTKLYISVCWTFYSSILLNLGSWDAGLLDVLHLVYLDFQSEGFVLKEETVLVGSLLGLLTNGIVCAQIIAYQPPPKKVKKLE
jgi:hypothetical protein